MTPQNLGLALAAVVVGASGVLLTRAGRPFGALLMTVHKLVALAALIVLAVIAFRSVGAASSPLGWLTAVLCVGAFATGGVVSAMQAPPSAVVWTHRIGSWVAIAAAAGVILAS